MKFPKREAIVPKQIFLIAKQYYIALLKQYFVDSKHLYLLFMAGLRKNGEIHSYSAWSPPFVTAFTCTQRVSTGGDTAMLEVFESPGVCC